METGITGDLVCISTIHTPLYLNKRDRTSNFEDFKPIYKGKSWIFVGFSGFLWGKCTKDLTLQYKVRKKLERILANRQKGYYEQRGLNKRDKNIH